MDSVKIRRPDDFHLHLRRGQMLANVLPFSADVFARAVIMGNTLPKPIFNFRDVDNYRNEIQGHLVNSPFEPIMSVMLTNGMTPVILEAACVSARADVLKLIPGGASTNSDDGVALENIERYYPVFERASELDMVFSIHGELVIDPITGEEIPEFDREEAALPFIGKIIDNFPDLRIVIEHVSTAKGIQFVKSAPPNVAATITVHHLIIEHDQVCSPDGEVANPYLYCKPVAKSWTDRDMLRKVVVSGNSKFFFGSDSAPHPISKKSWNLLEGESPAAGIFSAPVAMPLLWEVFIEQCGLSEETVSLFENFVSRFGAEFYGLPLNDGHIRLKREPWEVPDVHGEVPLFMGGKTMEWKVI